MHPGPQTRRETYRSRHDPRRVRPERLPGILQSFWMGTVAGSGPGLLPSEQEGLVAETPDTSTTGRDSESQE